MLILAYDTETTGLPVWKEPSESDVQPHLVEIAALLIDTDTLRVRDGFSAIIRPDGWTWDENSEAFRAHGIPLEHAQAEGIPEAEALAKFLHLHERADLRVGHNESFDARILRIAIKRYGFGDNPPLDSAEARDEIADKFKGAPAYCTMRAACKEMKLPATEAMRKSGRGRLHKNPNLNEAHEHYFNRPHDGAHRALADAEAAARLYLRLRLEQPGMEIPHNLTFAPLENGMAVALEADKGSQDDAETDALIRAERDDAIERAAGEAEERALAGVVSEPTKAPIPDCPQPESPIKPVVTGRGREEGDA